MDYLHSDLAHQRPVVPELDFQPLNRVVVGAGVIRKLGQLAREFGGTRALLVTDPGVEAAGHPQRAATYLRDAGLHVATFNQIGENPTTDQVRAGLELARGHGVDLLVAVGGGSAMDCAKGVNFLLTNGGEMADYQGFGKASKPMLPSIGLPTTAGTGSEAQSYALISDSVTHAKMACGDRKAAFRIALLDPEITVSQPQRVTAITGIDAIAHAIESHVCTRRNSISRVFSKAAWDLLNANFERVLKESANLEARSAMQLGAYFAGTAIENSMLGTCHACANPLTANYGLTHGIAVGLLLPHVIRWNAVTSEMDYDNLIDWGQRGKAAEQLAERVSRFLTIAGLPTKLSDCGVEAAGIPALADLAAREWTGKFNPRSMTQADFEALYLSAM